MSDREPAVTAASATPDVADAATSPAGPPPFSRPTPTGRARPTAANPRIPFVAPATGHPGAAPRRTGTAAVTAAPMTWPRRAELDAAGALDAVARRLRAGTLRLPVDVDPASPPAVLAAVLVGLHAETSPGPAPSAPAPSAPAGSAR